MRLDKNTELYERVSEAFTEWQILDLTNIYSKMYLQDIADRLWVRQGKGAIGVDQVERVVESLVSCHN